MTTENFKELCRKRQEQLSLWRVSVLVIFGAVAFIVSRQEVGAGAGFLVSGMFAVLAVSGVAETAMQEIEAAALNIGKPEEKTTVDELSEELIA